MEAKQLKLVRRNNLGRKFYLQTVRSRIKEKVQISEEIAMLRKTLYRILESQPHIADFSDDIITKFIEYHLSIEAIKASVKEECGL